ncbi:hypothetical protein ZOSMA_151G00270 [Zostera marina]|uniref:SWIM-type domain-containing protein n=1 Tax=Zostera marina TaxID=29655 RepID=A0A0K9PYA6_ZOSMR|nr:hypothetical protein ZOSMA_151G00270 [Zostera marina]
MGYAGNIGFNVRMGSTKINDQEMVGRRMLCSKQGYVSSTTMANIVNEKKQRRIRNSHSCCLAMIYISLDRSIKLWRAVNFIQDHNHPLVTPSKKRYLLVNRVITPLSRALFQSLNISDISPSDQYCVAAQEAGGFDHIQFTPSDLSNMRRDDRCNIIQRNADLLIELFEERKNKSPDFFFSFTRHEDGTIHVGEEGVYAKCTCRLFESLGISCRHLICYLTLNNVSILPETLVCNRWRALQRKRPTTTSHTTEVKDKGNLRPLFNHLISLAGENKDRIIYARKLLEDDIQTITDNNTASDIPKMYGSITRFHDSNTQSIAIGNPAVTRTKGCRHGGHPPKKSKRFISKRENNIPKQRSCSICGIKGHDKRSCP